MNQDQRMEALKRISELSKKSGEERAAWYRYTLTIATAMFGALITLKRDASPTDEIHTAFVFSISLLGMGILCGAASLYSEVLTPRREGLGLLKELSKPDLSVTGPALNASPDPGWIKNLRALSLWCLGLSVASLVAFAILLDGHRP